MSSPATHSKIHRALDALGALVYPSRRAHRRRLLQIIARARRDWPSADYGSGYLYQSFPALGLRGFRDTEARVAQMDIGRALAGRSVLEIGCNSGFLSLSLCAKARRYVAFDNNPFLIEMARLTQAELGDRIAEFRIEAMETFDDPERFDTVLSFANHSTWDGNMTLALETYFARLQALLVPGGALFFESHHPALENTQQLARTLDVMRGFFAIDEQRLLTKGSAWDRGRTFVRAHARV
jgi:SAM-dependent methyltransferase